MKADVRKIVVVMDEIHREMGREIAPPTRRAAAVAVIANPCVFYQLAEEATRFSCRPAMSFFEVVESKLVRLCLCVCACAGAPVGRRPVAGGWQPHDKSRANAGAHAGR